MQVLLILLMKGLTCALYSDHERNTQLGRLCLYTGTESNLCINFMYHRRLEAFFLFQAKKLSQNNNNYDTFLSGFLLVRGPTALLSIASILQDSNAVTKVV